MRQCTAIVANGLRCVLQEGHGDEHDSGPIDLPAVTRPVEMPVGGALVVRERPPQRGSTLSEIEFDVLLHGEEVPVEKDTIAVCIGAFVAAAGAAIGIVCATDPRTFTGMTRLAFDGLILFCLLTVAVATMSIIKLRRVKTSSLYKSVRARIEAELKSDRRT